MQILEDVRYAFRQFLQAPGFTVTAVLTLALGIGATTAIFTLVHAVLLKSLPVAKPSELYRIGDIENCCVNGGLQDNWSLFSYDKYKTFRDGTEGFSELAAFQAGRGLAGVRRSGSNQPAESQRTQYVSGNYFSMFGIGAYAGRVFTPEDDRKGAEPSAVMSYRAWQQKYGLDPSVIGSSFTFNGQPFIVVGVTPPSFYGDRLEDTPAFWLPLTTEPLLDSHGRPSGFPHVRLARPHRPHRPRGGSAEHRGPSSGGIATVAPEPGSEARRRGEGARGEADAASVSRRSGCPDDARRVSVGIASSDVGLRLRLVDRLRERGEPDARARGEPRTADVASHRARRAALPADRPGAGGEHYPGRSRGDCGYRVRVLGNAI